VQHQLVGDFGDLAAIVGAAGELTLQPGVGVGDDEAVACGERAGPDGGGGQRRFQALREWGVDGVDGVVRCGIGAAEGAGAAGPARPAGQTRRRRR
jgi:hypothetical protein